jgi:hypothetical protein
MGLENTSLHQQILKIIENSKTLFGSIHRNALEIYRIAANNPNIHNLMLNNPELYDPILDNPILTRHSIIRDNIILIRPQLDNTLSTSSMYDLLTDTKRVKSLLLENTRFSNEIMQNEVQKNMFSNKIAENKIKLSQTRHS